MTTTTMSMLVVAIYGVSLSCCLDNCPCSGRIEDRTGNCASATCAECTSDGYGWCDVPVTTARGQAQCVPLPDEASPDTPPEGCTPAQWHVGVDTCPSSGGEQ